MIDWLIDARVLLHKLRLSVAMCMTTFQWLILMAVELTPVKIHWTPLLLTSYRKVQWRNQNASGHCICLLFCLRPFITSFISDSDPEAGMWDSSMYEKIETNTLSLYFAVVTCYSKCNPSDRILKIYRDLYYATDLRREGNYKMMASVCLSVSLSHTSI